MESEKLLPCPNPWCDCPDELAVEPIVGTGAYGVECGCGFNGPALGTPELAIAAWNTRAPADLRSALEAETIERCAKVAEDFEGSAALERCDDPSSAIACEIADLIRALGRARVRAALAPTKGDVS